MALPKGFKDREFQKFKENPDDGGTDVRVCVTNADDISGGGSVTIPNGIFFYELSISSVAWTKVENLSSPLSTILQVNIQNSSGKEIKVRHNDPGAGYSGMVIDRGNDERQYQLTGSAELWVKAKSGSGLTINIEELGTV